MPRLDEDTLRAEGHPLRLDRPDDLVISAKGIVGWSVARLKLLDGGRFRIQGWIGTRNDRD